MGTLPLFVPLLLLLLLQLLAGVSCETCPQTEDISPCKCSPSEFFTDKIDLDCRRVSLKDIEKALDHFRGKTIDIVTIRDVKGDRLPSHLFRNTAVRFINIKYCDLQGLSDSDEKPPFIGLENSLKVLDVTSSIKGTNSLKTLHLSHLKNLNYLSISNNNIPELGNNWFAKGPLSLETVFILDCGLNKIGDKAFASLTNLQTLGMWGNRLTSFERSMMPSPISRVSGFSLEDNNLTGLPNDIFSGMPLLQVVHLKRNLIRRIEEKTWGYVWTHPLLQVDLLDNPLECDSHMEWMFTRKRPLVCRGTCDSPEHVKGVMLWDFIDTNQKLQPLTAK